MSAAAKAAQSPAKALAAERGVNERYLHEMRLLLEKMSAQTGPAVARSRNNQWTQTVPRSQVADELIAPLIGRVALDCVDSDLGSDFYIGPWYRDWEGIHVVSWAARVAKLFYEGSAAGFSIDGSVVARRTFAVKELDITNFDDNLEPAARKAADPFNPAARAALKVPTAPRRVNRPTVQTATSAPARASEPPEAPVTRVPKPPTEPALATKVKALPTPRPESGMRAAALVMAAIELPRTGHLSSLLATLQPDQYRLVTWPDDQLLVVQGAPGTGKTVIATHRAAYLTHPLREPKPLERVALVGPTSQYVVHVQTVTRELGVLGVSVLALPTMMEDIAGIHSAMKDEPDERLDTSWELGRLLHRAAARLRADGAFSGKRKADQRLLVSALLERSASIAGLIAASEDLDEWLAAIPSMKEAQRSSRYLPFLAAASQAAVPLTRADQYDHLVIDEAQDVRPLEWRLLQGLLRPGGSMSLFGDLNQRRCDWSPSSWAQLAVDLDCAPDEGVFEAEAIEIGYRSTNEILRFAGQLLPKGSRSMRALREGEPPVVERVARSDVVAASARAAARLADCHPDGLVAILTTDSIAATNHLREFGWGRAGAQWTRNGRAVLVLEPKDARGLEFDGVVVVEPASFPENLGRLGLLYTSLTRATRDLVVVHARPLPRGLNPPQ